MKKNERSRRKLPLKLHRETLLDLDKDQLSVAAGGDDFSVKFCTETCPPTGLS